MVTTGSTAFLTAMAGIGLVILSACSSTVTGTGTSSGASGSSGNTNDGGPVTSSGSSGTSGNAGGRIELDAEALCEKIIVTCQDTSSTHEDCVGAFGGLLVTQACVTALTNAECPALVGKDSTVLDTCLPPCTGTSATCNGDGTITACAEGRRRTISCAFVCASSSATYTDTCGKTYQSQQSTTGGDICWCQSG